MVFVRSSLCDYILILQRVDVELKIYLEERNIKN